MLDPFRCCLAANAANRVFCTSNLRQHARRIRVHLVAMKTAFRVHGVVPSSPLGASDGKVAGSLGGILLGLGTSFGTMTWASLVRMAVASKANEATTVAPSRIRISQSSGTLYQAMCGGFPGALFMAFLARRSAICRVQARHPAHPEPARRSVGVRLWCRGQHAESTARRILRSVPG